MRLLVSTGWSLSQENKEGFPEKVTMSPHESSRSREPWHGTNYI